MVGPKQAKFILETILGENPLLLFQSSPYSMHFAILYIFFLVTVSLKRLHTRGSGLTMVAAVSSCELDNGELMCAPNQIIRERFSG